CLFALIFSELLVKERFAMFNYSSLEGQKPFFLGQVLA
ncbi:MAG: hypothetical protein RLY27_531, partial [Pseudomonadota bacterium]